MKRQFRLADGAFAGTDSFPLLPFGKSRHIMQPDVVSDALRREVDQLQHARCITTAARVNQQQVGAIVKETKRVICGN